MMVVSQEHPTRKDPATLENSCAPVGVFDSGVGGLSVLSAIHSLLPAEPLIFLADQANVPYGPRPLEEVRRFSVAITSYLLAHGAKLIVVACNAASAASLHYLRQVFPQIPFVGMEPAVKPAAEGTQTGVVGVLATPATFQGALYASVIERFAQGVTVLQDTCPGLVGQVEAGQLSAPQTRLILERALQPMLAQGIDTIVLGCTHYPFVIPMIQEIAGAGVRVIDPAPAIARQVSRVLDQHRLRCTDMAVKPHLCILTSGRVDSLASMLPLLLGKSNPVAQVAWRSGALVDA